MIPINMNALPIEIIVVIITLLSTEHKRNMSLTCKKMNIIVKKYFYKILKYSISNHRDYESLMETKFHVKMLVICGRNICVSKINLTKINYEILILENLNLSSLREIKMLDSKISEKCKKLILCELCLTFDFIESLKCLEMCEAIELYESHNYVNDYQHIMMCTKTLPKLRKFKISQYKHNSILNNLKLIPITDTIELVTLCEKHSEILDEYLFIHDYSKTYKHIIFKCMDFLFYDEQLSKHMIGVLSYSKEYVLFVYKKYQTLLKYYSRTNQISFDALFNNIINLSGIEYETLNLKNINSSFYKITDIDTNISGKCKELSFCKSKLNKHFLKSIKSIKNCEFLSKHHLKYCMIFIDEIIHHLEINGIHVLTID